MKENKIKIRIRLVIIKNGKLLVTYTKNRDFYFYVGGHLEYGETVLEGCRREITEECGKKTEFTLKKILYVRDFFDPDNGEHNLELFILGNINKHEGLEHKLDPQHKDGSMWLTWLDVENLPSNLFPKQLSSKLLEDYKQGFPNSGEYIGEIG